MTIDDWCKDNGYTWRPMARYGPDILILSPEGELSVAQKEPPLPWPALHTRGTSVLAELAGQGVPAFVWTGTGWR